MNAKRIEILRMEASHAEAAAEIEKEVFSMPWSREAFVDSLKNPDVFYLAAMVQGELAGYCGFFQSFEEAEITGVAVAPAWQSQGIGSRMLEELIRRGEERGVSRYILEVRRSNEKAIGLYEKYGFERAGLRRGFYEKPKEDALIMILDKEKQTIISGIRKKENHV